MENPFKKPKTQEKDKIKKKEKSQVELCSALNDRLVSLGKIIKQEMSDYQTSLADGDFEDREGEETGSGEKRRDTMQARINGSLGRAEKMKVLLDSKNDLPQHTSEIQATYKNESITLDLDKKIREYVEFYQLTNINPPAGFEDSIREIFANNRDAILEAIEENGFDDMLLIPGNIPLSVLNVKMTDVFEDTFESSNFTAGGGFTQTKSQNVDKPRIVLVHKTQNMRDRPELQKTLNVKGQDVKLDQTLTLEDYLVFQRKYFEETGKHLDSDGYWTWLATKSGSRLVNAHWHPSDERVDVYASDLDGQRGHLGARPSHSFY